MVKPKAWAETWAEPWAKKWATSWVELWAGLWASTGFAIACRPDGRNRQAASLAIANVAIDWRDMAKLEARQDDDDDDAS